MDRLRWQAGRGLKSNIKRRSCEKRWIQQTNRRRRVRETDKKKELGECVYRKWWRGRQECGERNLSIKMSIFGDIYLTNQVIRSNVKNEYLSNFVLLCWLATSADAQNLDSLASHRCRHRRRLRRRRCCQFGVTFFSVCLFSGRILLYLISPSRAVLFHILLRFMCVHSTRTQTHVHTRCASFLEFSFRQFVCKFEYVISFPLLFTSIFELLSHSFVRSFCIRFNRSAVALHFPFSLHFCSALASARFSHSFVESHFRTPQVQKF